MNATVWDRRFQGREDHPAIRSFMASVRSDRFLLPAEIEASEAYARGLARASVLDGPELESILAGLASAAGRIAGDADPDRFEDVHSAVEISLIEEIGEAGKKLHTGRSRNEQVATDERLYLKAVIPCLLGRIGDVQARIIGLAERYPDVVMPGYTHLQRGQCLLFSHYIMSFFWQLERGRGRLADARKRLDALPLGSGALAGTSVDLDRDYLKDLLGFGALTENSYDAVSDRGFILETLFALALVLLDLSRMAEDFVLFSSAEFGFLRLDDSIATSSSLMPQKKNPDLFELIRSGPARLFGWLGQLFMVVKGLPSSYNKDLQEDKSALREGTEYAAAVLEVAGLALERIALDRERIREKLSPGLFATDLVAYLTDRGVRFREAHGLVSEIVAYAEMRDQSLSLLSLEELQSFHPAFETDVYEVFDPLRSVAKKRTEGSTNPEMVRRQIESAKRRLEGR